MKDPEQEMRLNVLNGKHQYDKKIEEYEALQGKVLEKVDTLRFIALQHAEENEELKDEVLSLRREINMLKGNTDGDAVSTYSYFRKKSSQAGVSKMTPRSMSRQPKSKLLGSINASA